MNFFDDFREIVINKLKSIGAGVNPKNVSNTNKLFLQYLQVLDKLFVPHQKLDVLFSQELMQKMVSFSKGTQNAIKDIKRRLEEGINILGYFSKDVCKSGVVDMLVRNWNIYHAHVDMPWNEAQKHVKRSNNLLFFTHKGCKVYFLDILPHPKGDEWPTKHFLEIIYDNWNDLLNIAPCVTSVKPSLSDKELYLARKRGVYVMVPVRDCVVFPPNLGIASSRDNNLAVRKLGHYMKNLKYWQKWLTEHENELLNELKVQTNKKSINLQWSLVDFDDKDLWIYEKQYDIHTNLPLTHL